MPLVLQTTWRNRHPGSFLIPAEYLCFHSSSSALPLSLTGTWLKSMELESERIRLSISSCSPYPSTKLYVSCFRCIHAGNCTGFVFDIVTRRCSLFLPSDNSVVNIGTIQGDIFLSSGKHTINQFQNWKRHAVICQQIILEPDRLYSSITWIL